MYVGRFAPTTSGPLHLGSLLAAVASFLDARAHGGRWLLRFDDIDTARSAANAEEVTLETLRSHGLYWDGVIGRQTNHRDLYWQAIRALQDHQLVFYCTCSRKQLKGLPAYPGTCRGNTTRPPEPAAIRVRVPAGKWHFHDRIQGEIQGDLAQAGGDFIVMRKENIPAYPLSVIVDDRASGITDVVRGSDLIENTLAQIFLARVLGWKEPRFAHIPVLNQRDGIKLSKRDSATAIDNSRPLINLHSTLHMLGMAPPVARGTVASVLAWAIKNWNIARVPMRRSVADVISL
ncbi:MAG: tRNA glutamyl-Q(34) synthetase GluQRS [Gammaproteobacteria bacterium]|nr:tRNA glutamyl-Q(34) synthetase GluQRS [Gammaproteobacteria bacterium]